VRQLPVKHPHPSPRNPGCHASVLKGLFPAQDSESTFLRLLFEDLFEPPVDIQTYCYIARAPDPFRSGRGSGCHATSLLLLICVSSERSIHSARKKTTGCARRLLSRSRAHPALGFVLFSPTCHWHWQLQLQVISSR
jgi:hypothetical protein